MKKIYFLFLIFIFSNFYSQTSTFFGNISDLVFRKETVITPSETDTLEGHLINYHFVKDSLSSPFLYNVHAKLNALSVFFASNKLGGENPVPFGKIGSTIITNKGIFDYGDSLLVDVPIESPRIITYIKKDQSKNPYIFLTPIKDKSILMPELLVFNRSLSDGEKQRIETFLSVKYGISINYISEKSYFSSEGDVIWNFKDTYARQSSTRSTSMSFTPLHDRVLVRRIEGDETTKGGLIIPDTAKEKPQEGEVVSVGAGGRRDDGERIPMDVKAGDRILFGKWSGSEIKLDGQDLLIMKESDILGVIA